MRSLILGCMREYTHHVRHVFSVMYALLKAIYFTRIKAYSKSGSYIYICLSNFSVTFSAVYMMFKPFTAHTMYTLLHIQ